MLVRTSYRVSVVQGCTNCSLR